MDQKYERIPIFTYKSMPANLPKSESFCEILAQIMFQEQPVRFWPKLCSRSSLWDFGPNYAPGAACEILAQIMLQEQPVRFWPKLCSRSSLWDFGPNYAPGAACEILAQIMLQEQPVRFWPKLCSRSSLWDFGPNYAPGAACEILAQIMLSYSWSINNLEYCIRSNTRSCPYNRPSTSFSV